MKKFQLTVLAIFLLSAHSRAVADEPPRWHTMSRDDITAAISDDPLQPGAWWWLFKDTVGLHEAPEQSEVAFDSDLETSGEFFEDALIRLERGETASAIIQLRNAIAADPSNLSAYLRLAELYLDDRNPALAQQLLEEARRQGADPAVVLIPLAESMFKGEKYEDLIETIPVTGGNRETRSRALVMHARAHAALRQYDVAREKLNRALSAQADLVEARIESARLNVLQSNLEAATDDLDATEAAGEYHPDWWLIRGEIERQNGEFEKALAHYMKALSISPEHRLALSAASDVQMAQGRPDLAEPLIERLRASHPEDLRGIFLELSLLSGSSDATRRQIAAATARDVVERLDYGKLQRDPAALFTVGSIHHLSGRMSEAAALMSQYLEFVPRDLNAVRLLAHAQLAMGRPTESLRTLNAVQRYWDQEPSLLKLVAGAHVALKEFPNAIKPLNTYLALHPEDREARLTRARVNATLRNYSIALADLEALDTEAPDQDAKRLQADILLALGAYDRLIKVIDSWPINDRRTAENLVIRGQALLGLGNVDAAESAFEAASEADPESSDAAFHLALIDRKRGNIESATAALKAIIRKNPSHRSSLIQLASLSASTGANTEAISYLKTAIEIQPSIDDSLRLVDLLMDNNRQQAARETLTELKLRYPSSLEVAAAEARLNIVANNPDRARQIYTSMTDRAFELGSVPTLVDVAAALFDLGDADGAKQALDRADQLAPESTAVLLARARLETREDKWDRALELASRAVAREPKNASGYSIKADLLMEVGRGEEALRVLEQGLSMTGENPALVLEYFSRLREVRGPEASIGFLEPFVDSRDDVSYRILRALAGGYADVDQMEKAVGLNELLIKIRPDDPIVLNNLALAYFSTGDDRARETARRAYDLAPENYAIMDTFGWILVNEGDTSLGLTMLRNALVRSPRVPEIRYHYAVALNQNGQRVSALEELGQLLQESGSFPQRTDATALYENLRGGDPTSSKPDQSDAQ